MVVIIWPKTIKDKRVRVLKYFVNINIRKCYLNDQNVKSTKACYTGQLSTVAVESNSLQSNTFSSCKSQMFIKWSGKVKFKV